MTDNVELRKKRSNFQRAITIFTNVLQLWSDSIPENRDVEYLKVALERLQAAAVKYAPHQDELELIEEEQAKCDEVNELYDRAVANARRCINSNKTPPSSISPMTPTTSSSFTKLPEIKLPTFDGAVEHWTSYFDLFTSLIDNDPNLTPVRKLQYLRLSLSEKAATCIKSLKTTDDNYAVALDILIKKYSCDRRVKFRHWELLKTYPRLQRDTSSHLSDLIDTFNQHVKALKNLGVAVDAWDIILIDLITSKISSSTVYQWELTLQEGESPSYEGLIAFLEKRSKYEELPQAQSFSEEEIECERHFKENVKRRKDGRYVVALPFNEKIHSLGESRPAAEKRLQTLRRNLQKKPNIESEYAAVLQEYIELGHMSKISSTISTLQSSIEYVLPHHAVLKETSQTTKLRVVFDGSMKTSTGISLNDALKVGPTIQPDLFVHLIKFRYHQIVLTGDIEKMYRQIYVQEKDRKYQRILWSPPGEPPHTYQLNTVTFGLASAPFLAIRCLKQLAIDEGHKYPLAAKALTEDFYVDDVLTGASSIGEAITLRQQLVAILQCCGMKIRQWASNQPEVLKDIPVENINVKLQIGESTLKTLGVHWNSIDDSIVYTVTSHSDQMRITKRTILAIIAKIFDPLGLLSPVITTAKLFLQQLWALKLDWDEALPANLHNNWYQFHSQLSILNDFHIKRKITIEATSHLELHGFSDASQKAYGACIYLKSNDLHGNVEVHLVCAKSRVAPLKSVSIPRLELCGALLLAQLITSVMNAIQINIDRIFCWTDSTVVLHWLRSQPHLLKVFVSNRVTEIQNITKNYEWRYVPTADNPADIVSRGQTPHDFMKSSLWESGPPWLKLNAESWPELPCQNSNDEDIPEKKTIFCFHVAPTERSFFEAFSSIQKLRAIIAYCLRFKTSNKHNGFLKIAEYRQATLIILKHVQKLYFQREIQALQNKDSLHSSSRLKNLHPFLDQDGILRVGGRINKADIPYSQKHPIILPKGHHITILLIREAHLTNLHAGIQTTLYSLRTKYWPLDGRNEVRRVIRMCKPCRILKPSPVEYIMGDLPASRLTPTRPFAKVGIDFCGPFYIKEKKYQNRKQLKIYVAIFICFCVKAVHIEVVSDLTSEAFIAALRRFIARRGICTDIYSDNATNFVGANHELHELYKLFNDRNNLERIHSFTSQKEIQWHFIPARSPNFGGLWEAAVKSFKHHLRRVVGQNLFTYEEFNTFTIEIEAVLNSRPLSPLSNDPNDLLALTPAHFLIGDSLMSLPEADLEDVATNRLGRWQHIQQVKQHFWSRWHREYLNELMVRHKWTKDFPSITTGQMVILKDDNLSPLQWPIGRIVQCNPGSDNKVRVVPIKTNKGLLKRSVRKIALLLSPFDS